MLPGYPGEHHESGTADRNKIDHSQHPRCAPPKAIWEDFIQRNLHPPGHNPDGRGINISGVDFWHAVEFSRNGHFLRTHPRHQVPRLSSGRFPSVLRFRLYQTLSRPIPRRRGIAFRLFNLPATLTIADPFGPDLSQLSLSSRLLGRSDVPNSSGCSRQFLIGLPSSTGFEFGHAEIDPIGRSH
jgi:hypothetical protein